MPRKHDPSRLNRAAIMRRLEELEEELADDDLPSARRNAAYVEYAQMAILALGDAITDEDCDPEERARLHEHLTDLHDRVEALHVASARQRVSIRWRGTEEADVELDGWMVAQLYHTDSGWFLEAAGDELGLPSEWVAPAGLNGPAADHASRRALARVVDQVARLTPRPGDDAAAAEDLDGLDGLADFDDGDA